MRLRVCAIVSLVVGLLAPASLGQGRYQTVPGRDCGGYPRLDIGMASGMCAGLVIQSPGGRGNMRLPRMAVPLEGTDDWLVSDLGGWNVRAGGIWRVTPKSGGTASFRRLLGGLEMPHTILRGPDARYYVGEMGRIFAFNPLAMDPAATVQDVVIGLPTNRLHDNRHPLSAFVFAADGALLVNVGAPSDQCLDAEGKPLGATCPEGEGDEAAAVVRRHARIGVSGWSMKHTVFASGLRNSMAFVVLPDGSVLQAENSIDIADADRPDDEINLLKRGRHYGWPYCMDMETPMPGWAGSKAMDCSGPDHEKPVNLIGPHSAPLGMARYSGAMFPQLQGKLLVTLHGYQPAGARIIALDTDAKGIPSGGVMNLTPGWDAKPGMRPRGSPVGITVAADGSIWVADDRSRAIIRIARDGL
jgi:glucose/arabinose dehydrogenase